MSASAGLDDNLNTGARQPPDHLGDEGDPTLGIGCL
jgi:hypothetical protein